jgi:hypothetical protein
MKWLVTTLSVLAFLLGSPLYPQRRVDQPLQSPPPTPPIHLPRAHL